MKWIFFIVALAAAGVLLAREKLTAAILQADLERHRLERTELEAQRREHARLLALQPTADEIAQLQRAATDRSERRRAIAIAERESREAEARGLPVGEWLPPTQWQDRGQNTPAATVQTILWAATGGDTARLATMLYFDESVRAKLGQVYAALPAHVRATYAGPEQLMAAFTAKAIPVGDAQVIWQQQSGPDDAVACIWINNSAPTLSLETPETSVTDKTPPKLPATAKRSQALLTMRRSNEGWRVIVPVHAVDKLARELAGGK
jgi:hypothetical protein